MTPDFVMPVLTLLSNTSEISSCWDNRPFYGKWPGHQGYEPDTKQAKRIVKKPKRFRIAFTTSQLKVLEEAYSLNNYADRLRRTTLSRALNIGEKHVRVWFQNRRLKYRRELRESNGNGYSHTANYWATFYPYPCCISRHNHRSPETVEPVSSYPSSLTEESVDQEGVLNNGPTTMNCDTNRSKTEQSDVCASFDSESYSEIDVVKCESPSSREENYDQIKCSDNVTIPEVCETYETPQHPFSAFLYNEGCSGLEYHNRFSHLDRNFIVDKSVYPSEYYPSGISFT